MTKAKRMAIVVHSGTLDLAYPPLMLASAAGASDMEVDIFFTFWGLSLLKKNGFKRAKLPGIMRIGTPIMKRKIKKTGIGGGTSWANCRCVGFSSTKSVRIRYR